MARKKKVAGKRSMRVRYRFRSAITGKMVTRKYAVKHPKTTLSERYIIRDKMQRYVKRRKKRKVV